MPSSGLFTPIFVSDRLQEELGDRAWLQAMLDVERALAAAEARAGVISAEAAEAIAACCGADRFDCDAIGRKARAAGNPVAPLVAALRAAVGGEAAGWVHWGATSQDVLDSAAMLVSKKALAHVITDLDGVCDRCAQLAQAQRSTLVSGRTLMQQALPITFGLKAAGWLAGCVEARRELERVRTTRLAAQLGGASGSLASLGSEGLRVVGFFSEELGLDEPPVPWHTERSRIAGLAAALGIVAGALAKISNDLILLSQTEVAEASEPRDAGRGGSSAMPHKRNPVEAVRATACARQVPFLCATLLDAMVQEHERAAGAWHAEWKPLRDVLGLTGGAAAWTREALDGLELRPQRMRENLDATKGLALAERVRMAVAQAGGGEAGDDAVREASARAVETGRALRDELLAEPSVCELLAPQEIDSMLDPATYLGSSAAFIDRAIAMFETEIGSR